MFYNYFKTPLIFSFVFLHFSIHAFSMQSETQIPAEEDIQTISLKRVSVIAPLKEDDDQKLENEDQTETRQQTTSPKKKKRKAKSPEEKNESFSSATQVVVENEIYEAMLHTYSHTHYAQSNNIKTLYVNENSVISFNNCNKPFIDNLDDTLAKQNRSIMGNAFFNNCLFLSVHLCCQSSDNVSMQWKSSPLYYHLNEKKFMLSFDTQISELNLPNHLKLVSFVTPTKIGDLGYEYNETFYCIAKTKLNEKLKEPLKRTDKGFPHTEIQGLSLLLDETHTLFGNLMSYKPQSVFIKMHSYNDICESCQTYILDHQPVIQSFINQKLNFPYGSIPVIFGGVANKPYGCIEYCLKESPTDESCEKHKTYTNWGYLREEEKRVKKNEKHKKLLRQREMLSSIEDYVSFDELGAVNTFNPSEKLIDLSSITQEKQPHFWTFIKRPNLSHLQLEESEEKEELRDLISCYGMRQKKQAQNIEASMH